MAYGVGEKFQAGYNHLRVEAAKFKEKRIISKLPPVVIRLFGDIDYDEQLKEIPKKFRGQVIILTTCDTSQDKVDSLRLDKWQVIHSKLVSDDDAKVNSALLLNEAVRYAQNHNIPHLFFLSSGFQRQIGLFYSMIHSVMKNTPKQDAYYFILPETHLGIRTEEPEKVVIDDVEVFLAKFFPFETALVMKTSMFEVLDNQLHNQAEFETVFSAKGPLGKMDNGIKLGGMEFFITLLSVFSRFKKISQDFSPKMLGITFPVPTRASEELLAFYRRTGDYPIETVDSMKIVGSLEVTPAQDKLTRRIATFRAAMKRLDITEDDIRVLFSSTNFKLGMIDAFKFHDSDSPLF